MDQFGQSASRFHTPSTTEENHPKPMKGAIPSIRFTVDPSLAGDEERMGEEEDGVIARLDKWLWAARFFKTRTLARAAIESERVLYNGKKAKPNLDVELGAFIQIHWSNAQKTIVVKALSTRRRSAEESLSLYDEVETKNAMPARPIKKGTGLFGRGLSNQATESAQIRTATRRPLRGATQRGGMLRTPWRPCTQAQQIAASQPPGHALHAVKRSAKGNALPRKKTTSGGSYSSDFTQHSTQPESYQSGHPFLSARSRTTSQRRPTERRAFRQKESYLPHLSNTPSFRTLAETPMPKSQNQATVTYKNRPSKWTLEKEPPPLSDTLPPPK